MMNIAPHTVGFGPWSFDIGPFAIIIVIVLVGIVVYTLRKSDDD